MPAAPRRAPALAAVLAALLGSAAPALAIAPATAPGPLQAPMITSRPHHVGPHGEVVQGTSGNWAGYAATGAKFTSVSASWVQPAADCTAADTWSSFWVGLDGDGSDSVEQNGSSADCTSGSPSYTAWYEMYPAYPVAFADPVQAGDQFTARVDTDAQGTFTLALADTTQGWSHTLTKRLRGARRASAEVIAEAPSTLTGPLPLTDFGRVTFTGATANGRPIGEFAPDDITMATPDTTLASTSALTGGNAFSVTWHHT